MSNQSFISKCLLELSLMRKRRKLYQLFFVLNEIKTGKTVAPAILRDDVWFILFATMVFGILLGLPVWLPTVGLIVLLAYKILPKLAKRFRPPTLLVVLYRHLDAYQPQDKDAYLEMVRDLIGLSATEYRFDKDHIYNLIRLKWGGKEELAIEKARPFTVGWKLPFLSRDSRFEKAANKVASKLDGKNN